MEPTLSTVGVYIETIHSAEPWLSMVRHIMTHSTGIAKVYSTMCGCCFDFNKLYHNHLVRAVAPVVCEIIRNNIDEKPPTIRGKTRGWLDADPYHDVVDKLRAERSLFKNVSICFRPKHHDPGLKNINERAFKEVERAVLDDPMMAPAIIQIIADAMSLEDSAEVIEGIEDLCELGMDSIMAMEVCWRLKEELDIWVPINWLFGPEKASFGRLIRDHFSAHLRTVELCETAAVDPGQPKTSIQGFSWRAINAFPIKIEPMSHNRDETLRSTNKTVDE